MISPGRGLCVLAALLCSAGARAGEFALYPTGPAQDAAFIRFVNAGPAPLDVIAKAGQAPLRIDKEQPVSPMFALDSGTLSLSSNGPTRPRWMRTARQSTSPAWVASCLMEKCFARSSMGLA